MAIANTCVGGDGLTLGGTDQLVLIANQTSAKVSNAAFAISSDDGWVTAQLKSVHELGAVYPTTAVVRNGTIYVVHSKLNELIQANAGDKSQLVKLENTSRS